MPVHILDTTVRDGSYEVRFQFTVADCVLMAGVLERAGFKHIEVVYGLGLGMPEFTAS